MIPPQDIYIYIYSDLIYVHFEQIFMKNLLSFCRKVTPLYIYTCHKSLIDRRENVKSDLSSGAFDTYGSQDRVSEGLDSLDLILCQQYVIMRWSSKTNNRHPPSLIITPFTSRKQPYTV